MFGEASEPTHRPISIGQSPSRRRSLSSTFFGVSAHELEGAHDAGSTGELVEGKEPQRIAHDDGDTGAKNPRTAQSSMSDHEGGKPEISLRFAAAGREEQQIGGLAVDVRPIDEASQIEQDESKLKRSPLWFR